MNQYIRIGTVIIVAILVYACSPKVSEKVVEDPTEKMEEVVVTEPVGCESFNSLNSAKKEQAMTSYVLYRDFLKLNQYDEALSYWKTGFMLAPTANGKVKYQFDDGVKIYKHYFSKETDPVKKKEFADKAMALYDQRIKCYGDEAYVNGRKAFDLYYHFQEVASYDEIYELFKSNIDGKGKDADYFVVNPFTKMLIDKLVNEEIEMSEAQEYALKLFDIIEYGKTNCEEKECEAWEVVESYAPVRLESLEGFDGFYDCTYYTTKYFPIFEANPSDCESINLAYQRLRRGGCDVTSTELQKISTAKKENCQVVTYTPGPLRLGFNAYNEGNYKVAVEKFREFVSNTEDLEKKAKYALLAAKIYYRDLKNFPKSRALALEAASYKPNWGEPFMLIGKLYASSGPLCGPGRGWDSQIVTWPAIDKFKHAKSIDPSVRDEANKWIATYSKYMPSKPDIFQRPSINENDSFYVGCWIKESTTVRAAK